MHGHFHVLHLLSLYVVYMQFDESLNGHFHALHASLFTIAHKPLSGQFYTITCPPNGQFHVLHTRLFTITCPPQWSIPRITY